MSFQPPPEGENAPPPPPPPGQWGPPPGGGYPAPRPAFDPKTVNPLDWGILGAGVLGFIFSLFDYYKASAFGISDSEGAFGDGFFGWFAALLVLAAAIVLAVELFAQHARMPFPARLVVLGLFAVAFLCSLITMFINPTDVPDKYFSHGFGYWVSFILILAGTVMALMRVQQTGTRLPGPLQNLPNLGQYGSRGGGSQPPN